MEEIRKILDGFAINMAGLEAVIKLHGKKIDALYEMAKMEKELIYSEADYLRQTITKVDKVMDLYYKIYPERLEGDLNDIKEHNAAQEAAAAVKKAEADAKKAEASGNKE